MLISTATATGSAHTRPGQPGKINNQDAIATRSSRDAKVIVLADGCGSQPHSEIGADIGANLAANMIMAQLEKNGSVNWDTLAEKIAKQMVPYINLYDEGSFDDALLQRFMFTLIAVVVHKDVVTVAAVGDGVVVIDDEIITLAAPIKNTPPYLGYLLRDDSPYHKDELSSHLRFDPICELPLADIKKSIVVGTDGLGAIPLEEIHHPGLLAKQNSLQFWLNTHAIERAEDDQIIPGICGDDVTMVMIRTKEAQAHLVESRSSIVKLKGHLRDFIEALTTTLREWDDEKPLQKAAQEQYARFEEKQKEYADAAEKIGAVLDCKALTTVVDEKLAEIKDLADEPDPVSKFPFTVNFGNMGWGNSGRSSSGNFGRGSDAVGGGSRSRGIFSWLRDDGED